MCKKCERPAKTVIRNNTISYRTVTEYNNRGELLSRDNQTTYNYDNTRITHPERSRNPFKRTPRPLTTSSNINFTTGTHNDYKPARHSLFGKKKAVVQEAPPRQITMADSAMAVVGGMVVIAGTIAAHASNPSPQQIQQQYQQPQQQRQNKSSRSERRQQQRMMETQPLRCNCSMWSTEGCGLHDWRYRRDLQEGSAGWK